MTKQINRIYHADRSAGPPQFITYANRRALAPFVLFDAGRTSQEDWLRINWHPHSGVATLTLPYGANLHHSDTGDNGGIIQDGGFQWMASGGGIWHKEEYEPKNGQIGILQLWVQLPPEEESGPVQYFNMQPNEIPSVSNTRVLIGEFEGVRSPAQVPVEITYLDVDLKANETWHFQAPKHQSRGFVFPKSGLISVAETQIGTEALGMFEEAHNEITIQAKTDAQFVVALGKPFAYPTVHEYGQMHTNQAALNQAKLKIAQLGTELQRQGKI